MDRRVTLKDIACRAGVDPSAVSMALRNHPRISVATRARLQALAREMGYKQDALLSALSRHRSAPGSKSVIAWLDNHDTGGELSHYSFYHEVLAGAHARAEELGFVLEKFLLNAPGMTTARLHTILRTRQIRGVLVAPQPQGKPAIEMHWEEFTPVTVGHGLQHPRLHSVSPNQYRQMRMMLAAIRALGYRRIGLYIDTMFDMRCDNHWQAGFRMEYHRLPVCDRVPVLSYDGPGKRNPAELAAWIRKHRPEVIIIGGNTEAELSVPPGIEVVYHTVFSSEPERAGINENGFLVGATTVEVLVGMLARSESGIPLHPQRVLIEGFWQPGNLKPKNTGG
ncbi:transcriptional regulator [Opitutaceae bacterium TAV1]|nr:transcriptional regulator [Opitutaceae bacterium TAV1]